MVRHHVDHYFSEKPRSALVEKPVDTIVLGHRFHFVTPSGAFSSGRADPGSQLLVESVAVKDGMSVLDLGCGWGFVGGVLKKITPSISITCTDVNERALAFAKRNARANGVVLDILSGHLYEPVKDKRFDAIIVNPPMKAGREICYSIIEGALTHLVSGGALHLVAMHNRGCAMLEKKMKEVFGNVEMIEKKSGFRVYRSQLVTIQ